VIALRRLLLRRCWLAALIVAAALLMRVLVPAGYMATHTAGGFGIELCGGIAPASPAMAMPGMHHEDGGAAHDRSDEHAQPAMPCAFTALAAPSLAAADPLILAIAPACVFAVAFRPKPRPTAALSLFLRPPLRAPPPAS
jgi:hypothetical protein